MLPEILIVEDEPQLAKAIELNLTLEGYKTTLIRNGNTAHDLLISDGHKFGLVVLDVMLPEKDGLTICKNIRDAGITTPVLFLSSRNTSQDKVLGLKAGGDDYLGKPFNLEEFLLRVQKLVERHSVRSNQSKVSVEIADQQIIGKGSVQFSAFTMFDKKGVKLKMSKMENEVLKYLVEHPNETISREEILGAIYKGVNSSSRTIDNLVLGFRKKLESDPRNPKHFISVRGVGYRYEP